MVFLLLLLFWLENAQAQMTAPLHFPVPTPASVELNVLSKDPMYLAFRTSVESTYGVKCGELNDSTVRSYFIEKFKTKCPLNEKSGVKIILDVHVEDTRSFIKSFKVRPYGKIKSQF